MAPQPQWREPRRTGRLPDGYPASQGMHLDPRQVPVNLMQPAMDAGWPAELSDPRWEWIDVSSLSDLPGTKFIRGACKHLELHEVTSVVTGEAVAQLCGTCDAQLPPPREDR
jgi:hypothetical protein